MRATKVLDFTVVLMKGYYRSGWEKVTEAIKERRQVIRFCKRTLQEGKVGDPKNVEISVAF